MKKKVLIICALLQCILGINAQTDITDQYLDNAGFDNGEFVSVGICTYAKDVEGNSADGSSLMGVDKWTAMDSGDAKAGGLFRFGSNAWITGNSYPVPETDKDGNSNGGALGIGGCWGGNAYYVQDLKKELPAGTYRIDICGYNANSSTTEFGTQTFGIKEEDGTTHFVDHTWTSDLWTTASLTFELQEPTTGEFIVGGTKIPNGSASSAKLFIDYVRIYAVCGENKDHCTLTVDDASFVSIQNENREEITLVDGNQQLEADTYLITSKVAGYLLNSVMINGEAKAPMSGAAYWIVELAAGDKLDITAKYEEEAYGISFNDAAAIKSVTSMYNGGTELEIMTGGEGETSFAFTVAPPGYKVNVVLNEGYTTNSVLDFYSTEDHDITTDKVLPDTVSFSIQAGEYVDITIDLKDHAPLGTGYQADFYLPEGISLATDSLGNYLITQPNGEGEHTLMSSLQSDGAIRVLIYSEKNKTFAESEGSVVSARCYADLNMTPGEYKVDIKNRIVSTQYSTQTIELPDTEYMIEVTDPIYYDLVYIVDGDTVKTESYPRETPITIIDEPTKEGYAFSGWSGFPEDSIMPAHDVTVTGSFSINYYKLTYIVDGEVIKSDSVAFGAVITPEPVQTKEGYTFSGWSEIPETMPAHDVTVTGSFSINSYKLTYIVDGEVYKEYTLEYATPITPEPNPVKVGYKFLGWSEIPETMPAHDVEVSGSFVHDVFLLKYVIDDEIFQTDSVVAGSTITPVEAREKKGRTFNGWDGMPEDLIMPAEDITVTGIYSVIDRAIVALDQKLTNKDIQDINKLQSVERLDLGGITSTSIPADAFCGINSLKEVIIPAVIKNIEGRILCDCPNLLEVIWNTTATIPATAFTGSNPDGNLFIFAPEGTESYATNGNVVINNYIDNVELKDAKPLQLSQNFTAGNISYTREFSKKTYIHEAGGWEAIVLPFDVQEVVSGKGGLSPFHTTDTDLHFWLGGLTERGFGYSVNMQANVPYVISMPNNDKYDAMYNIEGAVTFSAKNATVYSTKNVYTFTWNDLTLVPCYSAVSPSETVYAINDDRVAEYNEGAVFALNSRAVRPFEAYMSVKGNEGNARPYIVIGESTATGIQSLTSQPSTLNPIIYDLSGRRINQMEKGVNIVNGKKMLK